MKHGQRTPNGAFFHPYPKLSGLSRQFWQIYFGAFRVFSANLSAPLFGTMSPLYIFSINQPLFLQKIKPLYPNPKYVFI